MRSLWLLILLFYFSCSTPDLSGDWSSYLGDKGTTQFSNLNQITKENAAQLEVAWSFGLGDADPENRTQIQCNPLIVDGVLYGSSPTLKFFAVDAATGKEKWVFDPFGGEYAMFGMGVNRGLIYEEVDGRKQLFFTASSFLYAIDAETGESIKSFGVDGKVDLKKGLDRDVDDRFVISNTPGIISNDKLIIGTRVDESGGAAPGHIRAYDVRTGERAWIFHTIPHPGEFGHNTWPKDAHLNSGGANAWAGLSVDEERGMVFAPTGSASYDFYGGDRMGDNLFANSILALDVETGERIWHFQTIHHDVWDRDLPAPPVLSTITKDGKKIDVVIQITKLGFIYVLDRETGEQIFEVKEIDVPASTIPGEVVSKTQPVPVEMPFFARHKFDSSTVNQLSKESSDFVLDVLSRTTHGNPFHPPSEEGVVIFPGYDGGGEWGGAAFNPESQTLFVNANEQPWILTMVPVKIESKVNTNISQGKGLYQQYCAGCHGADQQGGSFMGNVPSLTDLNKRLDEKSAFKTIQEGKGAMPAFKFLAEWQVESITAFLLELEEKEIEIELDGDKKDDPSGSYTSTGYNKFVDTDGYPAISPPWGTLTAVDIANAKIKWQIPFGEVKELMEQGIPVTGTENYGGPVATTSGLLFIAATKDEKFRVIDQDTGDVLWEYQLPAAGYATPSIYQVSGKQYVVIACGGGKLGTRSGDQYVAFTLPD